MKNKRKRSDKSNLADFLKMKTNNKRWKNLVC